MGKHDQLPRIQLRSRISLMEKLILKLLEKDKDRLGYGPGV